MIKMVPTSLESFINLLNHPCQLINPRNQPVAHALSILSVAWQLSLECPVL